LGIKKEAKGKGKGKAKEPAKKSAPTTRKPAEENTPGTKKPAEESTPTTKKPVEESTPVTKKPADMVQVRENISDLVRGSAEGIATKVIEVAMTGQLASAKYLFEAVGLYPATEQTAAIPVEDSLAHTLLRRMGLPLDPVVTDEDQVPVLASDTKSIRAETTTPGRGEENPGGERAEEHIPVPEGEH
jgi:hypothetical protein